MDLRGVVLLAQLETGSTFRLNATGREIWRCLEIGQTVGELAADLAPRLGVPVARLAGDANLLAADLLSRSLLEVQAERR
jgi:hypothetical protein